jgi:hypothetical protein
MDSCVGPRMTLASALIAFQRLRNTIIDCPNIIGALSMRKVEKVRRSFHLQEIMRSLVVALNHFFSHPKHNLNVL